MPKTEPLDELIVLIKSAIEKLKELPEGMFRDQCFFRLSEASHWAACTVLGKEKPDD